MDTKKLKEKIVDVISAKLDSCVSSEDLLHFAQTISELERNEVLKETLGKGFPSSLGVPSEEKE